MNKKKNIAFEIYHQPVIYYFITCSLLSDFSPADNQQYSFFRFHSFYKNYAG